MHFEAKLHLDHGLLLDLLQLELQYDFVKTKQQISNDRSELKRPPTQPNPTKPATAKLL